MKIILEAKGGGTWFHGSKTPFPFSNFDPMKDGTGIVSSWGKKYGGFFFTSEFENAEFYAEYFVARTEIKKTHFLADKIKPSELMGRSIKDKKNYVLRDVLDGAAFSDIASVPMSNLKDIKILGWVFVGDETSLFEKYDEIFESEGYEASKEEIDDFFEMVGIDRQYLMNIPVFRKYYNTKS
jgi:hypothetical protein